ncbi:DUF4190 domain-containing protein [Anatilimnocola floriformis]|uniref:DUF4190 domain-containing protein n=1 Tax=Anatilimnocola floriformis TaxID=2948575 RepID=UPI0020C4A2F6|nr:DUF4190 domain-containing protein [Anatilimnocola floriformis]
MSYPSPNDPFGQKPPPDFPSPGGYYVPPQYDAQYGIRPPQTSPLAILSMIGGILTFAMSWVSCCCFFTPIVFAGSVASVAFGHIALSQIQRSMGSIAGRELAWIGLGFGYPAVVVSGFFMAIYVWAMVQAPASGPNGANMSSTVAKMPGEVELQSAEEKIDLAVDETALGNSPEAITLAKAFNERMTEQRNKLASDNPQLGMKPDDGNFVTWCELHDGQCALVVQVPAYRTFTSEGKIEIEKRAWDAAQEVLREKLPPESDLAVGTKGLLLWGSIMTGKTVAAGSENNGVETESKNPENLYPYFDP